ncbi:MAG: LytTR family DNA-binding domain-containing protein [Bacteroidota bacterium]
MKATEKWTVGRKAISPDKTPYRDFQILRTIKLTLVFIIKLVETNPVSMNCLIVDDDILSLTALRHLLTMDKSLTLIAECSDAAEAYKKIIDNQIDLLFLDIEMPEMNGIDLVRSLAGKRPMIIFTTSGTAYAAEAFDLNVVDFITKPVMSLRFLQAVTKAKELNRVNSFELETKGDEFVFIRDSNIIRRLRLDDIIYLEAMGDYVKICLSKMDYTIHSTLKGVEQKLNHRNFLKVHRSFIVNISKIDTMDGGMLIMEGNLVPVSDAYRAVLNRRMQIL